MRRCRSATTSGFQVDCAGAGVSGAMRFLREDGGDDVAIGDREEHRRAQRARAADRSHPVRRSALRGVRAEHEGGVPRRADSVRSRVPDRGSSAFIVTGIGFARSGLDDRDGREMPIRWRSARRRVIGGIAGGFLFELVARVLLLPIMGRALLRAPLLVPSLLFTDSDYIAGLTARPMPTSH